MSPVGKIEKNPYPQIHNSYAHFRNPFTRVCKLYSRICGPAPSQGAGRFNQATCLGAVYVVLCLNFIFQNGELLEFSKKSYRELDVVMMQSIVGLRPMSNYRHMSSD